jgi:hypothetical protein
MTRQKLTLEITCSNPVCQKLAVLTGRARKNVLKGSAGTVAQPAALQASARG